MTTKSPEDMKRSMIIKKEKELIAEGVTLLKADFLRGEEPWKQTILSPEVLSFDEVATQCRP